MADGVGAAAAGEGAKMAASGAMAGASIGSVVPGVGTLLGAGIGLLAGGIGGALAGGIGQAKSNQAQTELERAQKKAAKLDQERTSHAQREAQGQAMLDNEFLGAVGAPGQQRSWHFNTFGG